MPRVFTVVLENAPGALADVAQCFGESHVNILGMGLQGVGAFGVARFSVDDDVKAEEALRGAGYRFRVHDAIAVTLPHAPGEFASACRRLAESGVNVENAFVRRAAYGMGTELVLEVDDEARARKVLGGDT